MQYYLRLIIIQYCHWGGVGWGVLPLGGGLPLHDVIYVAPYMSCVLSFFANSTDLIQVQGLL